MTPNEIEKVWADMNAVLDALQAKRDAAVEAARDEYSVALQALVSRGIHKLSELTAPTARQTAAKGGAK